MEPEKPSTLQPPDYAVIGVVMLISAGIGVYYRFTGGRQKTAEEYFVANRMMGVVPLGICLMVSFVSAITTLGISAEIYAHGTQFYVHYVGAVLATIVVAYFYLPVFFELNTVSVYEYLEKRFGVAARLATSVANFVQLTLYTGIVLYAPSLAIEATTGLSSTTSILWLGLICIFYSAIGGIKAVLVTDVFQGVLMFVSLVCIVAVASGEIEGGLASVWDTALKGQRVELLNFQVDPTVRHTWWCLVAGGFCLFCSLGVNQVQVQRLLTVKSLRSSQLALFLSLPILVSYGTFTMFCGLVLYAVYRDCDPVAAGRIASHDRIMPYFAATKMSGYPGLVGLFVAGIFSASLSTVSAMLNSLALVFLEDYLKRGYARLGKTFPVEQTAAFGKTLAVANGLVSVGMALLAGSFGSLVQLTLSVMGSICGPVLGIFTLGMFIEEANEKGAIFGMSMALLTCLWANFGRSRTKAPMLPVTASGCANFTAPPVNTTTLATGSPEFYLYRISYMWLGPMGLAITVVVGYCASLVFRELETRAGVATTKPDPSLFTPWLARRIRRRRGAKEDATAGGQVVLGLEELQSVAREPRRRDLLRP
ncbi:putative sodium-dependent multivitamin transporter [Copidosoma floridanum]|uniref:putative sodium-dependent multivitamin transporter n=1 Tax=Copidosoma floridanum TaxID=29053 RepID=UPI0006C975BE|nr:putative sodium-dependent multivitamin transporter [Copidosoma floridanum]